MKKSSLILLTFVLLACTTVSHAQYTVATNANNTLTITGYTGAGGQVAIPGTINGLTVTAVGSNSFEENFSLTTVTFPNSITNIGDHAFDSCGALSIVTFGTGLTSIGNDAFFGCVINNLTLPASLTSVGNDAFRLCRMFNLTIPGTVTTLGSGAFGQTMIGDLTLPASVTNVVGNPFAGCTRMGVISVAAGNLALSSVAGVLYNHDQTSLIAFPPAQTLTSYNILPGVTNITESAFYAGSGLSSVIIPEGVVSIGSKAFFNCFFITNLNIPDTVINIGDTAFGDCGMLTSINADPANPSYASVAGVLFNKNLTTLIRYGSNGSNSYTIPDGVTNLANYAFSDTFSLTNVVLPASLTSIGDEAFFQCGQLAAINLTTNLVYIGERTLSGCSFTNIIIPTSVTTLGPDAFAQCHNLGTVVIPASITNFGEGAFVSCNSLTNVTLADGLTSIGPGAFQNCSTLSSMIIPASVTNIGASAFFFDNKLIGLYYEGNAPTVGASFSAPLGTNYYLPGASGWSNFTGFATALWTPSIKTTDGFFGIKNNQFGFNVSWASNLSVVVEARADLNGSGWTPLATATLTNGLFYFSDAQWTNYPRRYYHVRSP